MSIIKYRNGEVRLAWKIIIAVVISVVIAFLLRFIPIFLSTALQAGRGMDRQDALEAAKVPRGCEHPDERFAFRPVRSRRFDSAPSGPLADSRPLPSHVKILPYFFKSV